MHARFRLQPPISVGTANLQSNRFQPRPFPLAGLHDVDFVAALLRPSGVHTHQHLCPILRFCAALAGVQFDETIIAVCLTGQQADNLLVLGVLGESAQALNGLTHHFRLGLRLRQFDQTDRVGYVRLELGQSLDTRRQPIAFAHNLLRAVRIVPQRGILDAVVQLIKTSDGNIPVKDASSAAP